MCQLRRGLRSRRRGRGARPSRVPPSSAPRPASAHCRLTRLRSGTRAWAHESRRSTFPAELRSGSRSRHDVDLSQAAARDPLGSGFMDSLMRVALLVALSFVFTSCEGPSSLYFETGGVDVSESTSLVVCEGSSIRLDVSFFSHAGSDAEFEIDEARIEPPSVMDVDIDIDSSGVAWTHVLTIVANGTGEAIL